MATAGTSSPVIAGIDGSATALAAGCVMFLTNDPVFKRIPGLPVTVLSEAVAAP